MVPMEQVVLGHVIVMEEYPVIKQLDSVQPMNVTQDGLWVLYQMYVPLVSFQCIPGWTTGNVPEDSLLINI